MTRIEGRISTSPWMTKDSPHPKIKCLVILLESVGKDYIYVANQLVEVGDTYCFEDLNLDSNYVIKIEYVDKDVKKTQLLEYELKPEYEEKK